MLLSVLLLRLSYVRPDPVSSAPADDTFRRYSAALERDFRSSHRVADYAAALGYSPRTLTRATLTATGTTAKQYLDARILLEAKRLLVHTDATAADISRTLGFTEPTDFAKFFRKRGRPYAAGVPGGGTRAGMTHASNRGWGCGNSGRARPPYGVMCSGGRCGARRRCGSSGTPRGTAPRVRSRRGVAGPDDLDRVAAHR